MSLLKSNPTSEEAFDEVGQPFDKLTSALEVTLLCLAAGVLVKAASGERADVSWSLVELRAITEAFQRTASQQMTGTVLEAVSSSQAWAEAKERLVKAPVIDSLSFGGRTLNGIRGDRSNVLKTLSDVLTDFNNSLSLVNPNNLWLSTTGGVQPFSGMFQRLATDSFNAVSTGTPYKDAIKKGLETIRQSGGVKILTEDGRAWDVYGFMRYNVTNSWQRAMQGYRDEIGRELEMDGVQISAHWCCATDHLPYQGKVYSLERFNEIQESLPRPIAQGMNCRHIVDPCWKDDPSVWASVLPRMNLNSAETVVINGQKMTRYDATQWQRSQERSIRRKKTNAIVAEYAGDNESASYYRQKANEQAKEYRAISRSVGLRPDPERLMVGTLTF